MSEALETAHCMACLNPETDYFISAGVPNLDLRHFEIYKVLEGWFLILSTIYIEYTPYKSIFVLIFKGLRKALSQTLRNEFMATTHQ